MALTASPLTIDDSKALPDLPFAEGAVQAVESLLRTGATPAALPTHADPVTPPELLANFNDFRRWLATKGATDIVGEAQTSGYCPLATYLQESGVPLPSVSKNTVRWEVRIDSRHWLDCPGAPLPKWAERFVDLVDGQGVRRQIRASLAATLLYEAVRESIGR